LARRSALPAVDCRYADRPLQPRHPLLEHRCFERAREAVDQIERVGGLRRREVALGDRRRDGAQSRGSVRRGVERRQLEGDRAITLARRDAIEANPDRRDVARLGQVDGGPNNLLGLAFEQPFGQDGGLAARTFGPVSRISAFVRFGRSWVSPWCES
jgi:hypothetical protein